MTLPPDRLDRFARHIVLPEIGGAGQIALAQAHVLLVGVGGIGSPALQYLAGAGIGRLTLVDDDVIDASNLQRQTIYREADIGRPKAVVAAEWVAGFDRALKVTALEERIGRTNAASLEDVSLVVDGCDNFATRLAVSDACVKAGVPLLSAAVGRFQGQVAAFKGHEANEACYRCFVGDAFDAEDCDSCADDGMLGAMAGWVGTFAALHAIRALLDGRTSLGSPQWGHLHLLDGMKPGLRTIRIAKDPDCKTCGLAQ